MAVYNNFYEQLKTNDIMETFVNLFCEDENRTGYIVVFGLPEKNCRFKESQAEWQESIFHKTEAKVRLSSVFIL